MYGSVLESGANSLSIGMGFNVGSMGLSWDFPEPDQTAPGDRKIFPTKCVHLNKRITFGLRFFPIRPKMCPPALP